MMDEMMADVKAMSMVVLKVLKMVGLMVDVKVKKMDEL